MNGENEILDFLESTENNISTVLPSIESIQIFHFRRKTEHNSCIIILMYCFLHLKRKISQPLRNEIPLNYTFDLLTFV